MHPLPVMLESWLTPLSRRKTHDPSEIQSVLPVITTIQTNNQVGGGSSASINQNIFLLEDGFY
jgi:hypothetical protein